MRQQQACFHAGTLGSAGRRHHLHAAPQDPIGKGAWQQIARVDPDAVTNYKVMLPIMAAADNAATPAIQQASAKLRTAYNEAILTKGSDDEVTTKIEAFTAATELRTACIKAGLGG